MKHKLLKLTVTLTLLLLSGFISLSPAQAGDPDKTVGPADPNFLICADRYTHLWFDSEYDAFNSDGSYNPNLETNVDLLKEDCKKTNEELGKQYNLVIEYARQTRIEGYVFEFHPDPNSPGGWMAVRSRDVPVIATGHSFEVMWGSEKDGFYYFNNFGAGPITLNLRLPPDAHPINPNITVMSASFAETWEVDLGFYRGDIPPEDIEALRLPADHQRGALLPADTLIELDEKTGLISYMPNVGEVLPQSQSLSTLVLAGVILVILPIAGILTLRRKRS